MWIKSSKSHAAGQCVEQQEVPDGVMVRDSKNPDGPALFFTHAEYAAWLEGAKAGEFDHLASPRKSAVAAANG